MKSLLDSRAVPVLRPSFPLVPAGTACTLKSGVNFGVITYCHQLVHVSIVTSSFVAVRLLAFRS